MESSNAILIIKALDGLSARAVVTAENIANAGTPNYRPLRVSFEAALQEAAASGNAEVSKVAPNVAPAAADTPDGELRLDREMATASSTELRYGALIDILSRQIQMDSLAITGTN